MKILIIEDNRHITKILKTYLAERDFSVDISHSGKEGFEMARNTRYDLIILDLMLPYMSGFEIITGLRTLGKKVLIMIISARDSVIDRIKAINLGADDYLTKEFVVEELLARINALIRRKKSNRAHNILRCCDLRMDTGNKIVVRGKRVITLTKIEFRILETLLNKKHQLVTTRELAKEIWNNQPDKRISNKLNVHIRRIRQKLNNTTPHKPLIKTVRGFGYKITDKN